MVESGPAGAAEPSQALTSADEQSVELEDAIAHLEVAHMSLRREGAIYARQSSEMLDHSKVLDEQIEQLRDRFTAVSSELGQQQMSTSTAAEADASAGADQNELVSYDSVASTINAACKKALRSRLQDPKFVDELLSRRGGAEVVHCRVVYSEEAIDWKVYDDADGTEATGFKTNMYAELARHAGLRYADVRATRGTFTAAVIHAPAEEVARAAAAMLAVLPDRRLEEEVASQMARGPRAR